MITEKIVTNLDVFPLLESVLKNGESILDVGCGGTEYDNKREHDVWNKFDSFKKRVGMDIYQKEIEWRIAFFPNDGFLVGDAFNIDKFFPDKSFDVVHCQNVIEHMEKNKAIELIKKMEKIAKKQVILGTPKGFRQSDAFTIEKNPFQRHFCEFTKEELENLGYVVIEVKDLYYFCYKNFSD